MSDNGRIGNFDCENCSWGDVVFLLTPVREQNFDASSTSGRNDGQEITIYQGKFLFLEQSSSGLHWHDAGQELVETREIDGASDDQRGVLNSFTVEQPEADGCNGLIGGSLRQDILGAESHDTDVGKVIMTVKSKRTHQSVCGYGKFNRGCGHHQNFVDVEQPSGINQHDHEGGSWSVAHCGQAGTEQTISQIGDLATILCRVNGQNGTRWDRELPFLGQNSLFLNCDL